MSECELLFLVYDAILQKTHQLRIKVMEYLLLYTMNKPYKSVRFNVKRLYFVFVSNVPAENDTKLELCMCSFKVCIPL